MFGLWCTSPQPCPKPSNVNDCPEVAAYLSVVGDGKVHFLSQRTDGYVVGALCTRNGGEIVSGY